LFENKSLFQAYLFLIALVEIRAWVKNVGFISDILDVRSKGQKGQVL